MNKFICLLCFLSLHNLINAQETIPAQTVYNSDFNIDGIARNCLFYIPLGYGKKESYPLLIMLHDNGSNAKSIIKNYGDVLHAKADSIDAVIVYPDGVHARWNSNAIKDSVNDVGFISIITEYFIQRYQCDITKVFVAGFGNGGKMAKKLACDLPTKITAVAAFLNADEKEMCNNTIVPEMPYSSIHFLPNGKLGNESFGNMWKFFTDEHAK